MDRDILLLIGALSRRVFSCSLKGPLKYCFIWLRPYDSGRGWENENMDYFCGVRYCGTFSFVGTAHFCGKGVDFQREKTGI
ncbi:MAG: hypothetical protein HFI94_07910 [Lachnospiraceae bacterium]|nr:hypothetical protein [Lachnospiraceae bacterium]